MPIFIPTPLTQAPLAASDEELLFGRAAEVETIVENCRATRLTVVISAPGLGTSSLLRAGVVPALQRAGFITVVYSDWLEPSFVSRLREAIQTAIREQADSKFSLVPESLFDLLGKAQARTGKTVAVILDQFEDYLRCHAGTDVAEEFDADLANAVSARRLVRFVIGVHDHAVPAFERLDPQIPNLMGYTIHLAPLPVDSANQLVCRAASLAGVEMQPEAAQLLVAAPVASIAADANQPGGVHPLFLKLAAARLIDTELDRKSTVARASTILEKGGADRLILESLDLPIRELGRAHNELLYRWIPMLISPEGRRRAVAERSLLGSSGRWNRLTITLLPLLLKSGLLRSVPTPGGIRYELARESAIVVLRDWWKREEVLTAARLLAQLRLRLFALALAVIVAILVYLFLAPVSRFWQP